MNRFVLLLGALTVAAFTSRGQCVISKDTYGQIITTCEVYTAQIPNQLATAPHKQISYLGSEFFTFPVWQTGSIQLNQSGREIPCRLAYNLVTNTVQCQFDQNLTATDIAPYAFTINGVTFIRQLNSLLGIDYQSYSTVLYNGQTKLLRSVTSRLVPKVMRNDYRKGSLFEGYYQIQERYYIRKGEAPPQLTTLSKNSLMTILYEQAEQIAGQLTKKQLTSDETVKILAYYDSLTTAADLNKPSLSRDAVFNEFLHDQLKYPNRAWNSGVYGRVYAGFEVDEAGQVINIALLSPDNIGFGFDQAVKQALSKLAKVNPVHVGKYVLPASFTYTNTQDKAPTHVPINTLPAERFDGRTVLQEFVVPILVSKPLVESREVWGYYK